MKDSLIENPSIKMLQIDFAENYTTVHSRTPPPLLKGGGGVQPSKNRVTWGGGYQIFC